MPFYVIKGDLVNMNVDAIVNAANVSLKMVEGVTRAIFHKAGDEILTDACKKLVLERGRGGFKPGDAIETPSFNLKNCKIIIHAIGPNYINGKHNEEKNLIRAYKESFAILNKYNYHSIAFPLLSGEFNYPLKEAYKVASNVILDYLKDHKDDIVYLVMYKTFPMLVSDSLQEELTKYIIEETANHKINEKKDVATSTTNVKLVETIRKFQVSTNTSDDELILRGNLSHRQFERLLENPNYIPTKNCIIAFAIAMKLSEEEMEVLIKSLGYTYSKYSLLDLIVGFFLQKGIYDVYMINNALFGYEGILPIGADF